MNQWLKNTTSFVNEYLKYFFFVIGNMLGYKSIVKFVISLTSLIIKTAQPFEKIYIFYKIWGILQWDGAFFCKGDFFFLFFLWWGP